MKKENTLYCSLDIETSGFDPAINEILEVGFAFFTVSEKGLKVVEEFTKVFKPTKPVTPQILGLTGISQKELDEAPSFAEFKTFLQEKLGKAIILGHNISFDTKFLEGFGLKFSGEIIDTLDLVQWLLPTHHSYNLENLMHTFGIAHKEAHRALADSKATILLLEKLLGVFNILPEELQDEIKLLASSFNLPWVNLLEVKLKKDLSLESFFYKQTKQPKKQTQETFRIEKNTVYNFELGSNYLENLTTVATGLQEKTLIVVPRAQKALDLYKNNLVDGVLFLPEYNFDAAAFAKFKKKKNLSIEELKFILKILVWQSTNWQIETILDLNLSFFGGQFRDIITGGEIKKSPKAHKITCDHATFLELSNLKLFTDRHVIIVGLNEFENAITSNIGVKASWGYISYVLKSFYNSELNSGAEEFKEPVEKAILACDLFFGLINALLQTDPPSFQYYKISSNIENSESYVKINGASEGYVQKLKDLNLIFKSESITKFIESIQSFFNREENMVKWIELSENHCSLQSMPIQINGLVERIGHPYNMLSFVDSLGPDILPNFFIKRLGLEKFNLQNVRIDSKNTKSLSDKGQGDLFYAVKKSLSTKSPVVNFHFFEHSAGSEDYINVLNAEKSIQAVVLFNTTTQIRDFYEQKYQELKTKTALLAQSHTGGSNKLLRNFAINPNSLLLATDKFILKALNSTSQVEQVQNLSVKTLVISRLPFEQFSHPYQEAVSNSFPNAFTDYSLPKALYNYLCLIKFFYTPKLENIYLFDAKLSKDYAKVFKDLYRYIPNANQIV